MIYLIFFKNKIIKMEEQYDNSIAPQQNQNKIQVNQPQVYNDQSPGIEMNPIVNNQMDNANLGTLSPLSLSL